MILEIDFNSAFYKNCRRNRKVGARICTVCPFREFVEKAESLRPRHPVVSVPVEARPSVLEEPHETCERPRTHDAGRSAASRRAEFAEFAEFLEAKEWMAHNREWLKEHRISTVADLLSRIRPLTVETVFERDYLANEPDRESLKRAIYRELAFSLAAELLDRAARVDLIAVAGSSPAKTLVRARAQVLCVLPRQDGKSGVELFTRVGGEEA